MLPCQYVLVVLFSIGPLLAQTEWVGPAVWEGANDAAVSSEPQGGVLVFGGTVSGVVHSAATWRFGRGLWQREVPVHAPGRRTWSAMAYDHGRARVVLFGGSGPGGLLGDTWEWDGVDWTQRQPQTLPPARHRHAMAYDSARGRVVMFGGQRNSFPQHLDDTWEWDGNDWIARAPAMSPSGRFAHRMAYDSRRQRSVLFGGKIAGSVLPNDETWEWDGLRWLRGPSGPPGRIDFAMAYDPVRARTVTFGGRTALGDLIMGETWEWDGTNWSPALGARPPARASSGMAWVPTLGGCVLTAGHARPAFELATDSWLWSGAAWSAEHDAVSPSGRSGAAMAHRAGSGQTLLFGGYDAFGELADLWIWDGFAWSERFAPNAPAARRGHGIVHDTARDRMLLIGGASRSQPFAETWSWQNSAWTLLVTPTATPFISGSFAYDSRRDRVVAFGNFVSNDTWEFDGVDWSLRTPVTRPPARPFGAMAYDRRRGVTVLFGGGAGLGRRNDTWEWDGQTWLRRQPMTLPLPRSDHRLIYDDARSRCVLFGGRFLLPLDDVWEWDGFDWFQRTPVASPGARVEHALAWDARRRRVVMFGGMEANGRGPKRQTWLYGPAAPATVLRFGNGCAGIGTQAPSIASVEPGELPWRSDVFELELSAPGAVAGAIFVGASATRWGTMRLPLRLDGYGLTGCLLFTSLDVTVPLVPVRGVLRLSLPLPNDPALDGVRLFVQGLTRSPAANAAGWLSSDALNVVLGSR